MSNTLRQQNSDDDYSHTQPPQRRSTEPSSFSFEHGYNDLDLIPSFEREIIVYRDGVSGDRHLVSPGDKTPLYFARVSMIRPGIPDLTLFAGSDKHGVVIGTCYFTTFSITVGHGDPANPNNVNWETVSKTSRDHSSYKFSIDSQTQERKSYSWKRTHDPSIKGTKSSKLNKRSWKLVDDATEQVVAVFASNGIKSWKEAGRFRFLANEGKAWEEWVLLTCLGLSEKARRRAMARRDLSWFL
jgi:hypothetical protein